MTVFRPLHGTPPGIPVINDKCLDVRKSVVNKIFWRIYGYSSEVSEGWAVEKPELTNGMKDVRLVNLDTYQKRDDYFYQRYITKGIVTETWLTIMNYNPVIRLEKLREISDEMIAGRVIGYELKPVVQDEKITAFCREIGLNYGELDVLNGVIIDVNPTPGDAAWVYMPADTSRRYQQLYADQFKKNYL